MCKDATKTAASLMAAIEPTLDDLLTAVGVASTTEGQAALKAFAAAQSALANWQPGDATEVATEAINAFTAVFDALPIPADAQALEGIISAGIVTVLGVIGANSPAPPSPVTSDEAATPEETQVLHQAAVIHDTTLKVTHLVPGFKRSIFTSPAHQYKNAWNRAAAANPKYASLKVA